MSSHLRPVKEASAAFLTTTTSPPPQLPPPPLPSTAPGEKVGLSLPWRLRREAADDLVLGVDEAEADLGGVPGEGDALFLFLVWFRGTWSGGRERALTEKWSRSTKPDRQKKGISSCFSSVVFRRSLLLDCSSITSTAKESTHSTKRAMFQNLERDAWTGAGLRNVRVFAKRNHRLDQDKLLSLLSPYPQRVARRHFSSNCSGKRRLHRESVRALSFSRAISVCSSERAK